MLKRILAWILLAGFVFLIFNIIIFGYYLQLSIIIYLIIVFFFLLTNRKPDRKHDTAGPEELNPGSTEKVGSEEDREKDGE